MSCEKDRNEKVLNGQGKVKLAYFRTERSLKKSDYLSGWLDCFLYAYLSTACTSTMFMESALTAGCHQAKDAVAWQLVSS